MVTFFSIDCFGLVEHTGVLDAGHPVLVVDRSPIENINLIEAWVL